MYNIKRSLAELCNGSTTDSDSVCWGSNPYSAAKTKPRSFDRGFVFITGFEQGGSKSKALLYKRIKIFYYNYNN